MHSLHGRGEPIDSQREEIAHTTPLVGRADVTGQPGCVVDRQVFPSTAMAQGNARPNDLRLDQPVGLVSPCSEPYRNRSET